MDGITRIAEVSAAATAAGINPWLAALTLVGLAHFGWMDLGALPVVGGTLADPAILTAIVLAFLVEQVADKVPGLDHLSDLAHLPIKPAAAVALALVVAAPQHPSQLGQYAVPLGIAAAGVALLAHLGKAGVRAGSTAGTGGAANPVISVFEDLSVVFVIVAAVVVPLLALALVVLALGVAAWGAGRLVRGRRERGGRASAPAGVPGGEGPP